MDNTDQDNTTARDRDLAPGYEKVKSKMTVVIYKAIPTSLAHYESPGTQLTSTLTQLAITAPEIGHGLAVVETGKAWPLFPSEPDRKRPSAPTLPQQH